uniref:Nucleoside diphosphate kinase n=1 Tax=Marseillevirus LCMAC201 TaxID=2506605 RepID=A0A481YWJ4_9VIRU|nr:MAG: nucleoside diphosphate kinase [Marseillevirus LCMAC201]
MSNFLVFAKPDAVRRNLIGEIIGRFESRGFVLKDIKYVQPTRMSMETHYQEHCGKPFFNELVTFSCSGPIVPMIWRGDIYAARALIGVTNPHLASPGTIRGDLASSIPDNLVHCSDSEESAQRELEHWFSVDAAHSQDSERLLNQTVASLGKDAHMY